MDTEAFSKELGLRLRKARMRNGMSLTDVQERTGGRFDAATVRTYEVAERNIPVEKFADLAMLYGISARALVPDIPDLKCTVGECPGCGTRLVAAAR